MWFSDFKCSHCGYYKRWWDGIRRSFRCPVFQCMFDNGWDVLLPNLSVVRIGAPMEYLGTFKDVVGSSTHEKVIHGDGSVYL